MNLKGILAASAAITFTLTCSSVTASSRVLEADQLPLKKVKAASSLLQSDGTIFDKVAWTTPDQQGGDPLTTGADYTLVALRGDDEKDWLFSNQRDADSSSSNNYLEEEASESPWDNEALTEDGHRQLEEGSNTAWEYAGATGVSEDDENALYEEYAAEEADQTGIAKFEDVISRILAATVSSSGLDKEDAAPDMPDEEASMMETFNRAILNSAPNPLVDLDLYGKSVMAVDTEGNLYYVHDWHNPTWLPILAPTLTQVAFDGKVVCGMTKDTALVCARFHQNIMHSLYWRLLEGRFTYMASYDGIIFAVSEDRQLYFSRMSYSDTPLDYGAGEDRTERIAEFAPWVYLSGVFENICFDGSTLCGISKNGEIFCADKDIFGQKGTTQQSNWKRVQGPSHIVVDFVRIGKGHLLAGSKSTGLLFRADLSTSATTPNWQKVIGTYGEISYDGNEFCAIDAHGKLSCGAELEIEKPKTPQPTTTVAKPTSITSVAPTKTTAPSTPLSTSKPTAAPTTSKPKTSSIPTTAAAQIPSKNVFDQFEHHDISNAKEYPGYDPIRWIPRFTGSKCKKYHPEDVDWKKVVRHIEHYLNNNITDHEAEVKKKEAQNHNDDLYHGFESHGFNRRRLGEFLRKKLLSNASFFGPDSIPRKRVAAMLIEAAIQDAGSYVNVVRETHNMASKSSPTQPANPSLTYYHGGADGSILLSPKEQLLSYKGSSHINFVPYVRAALRYVVLVHHISWADAIAVGGAVARNFLYQKMSTWDSHKPKNTPIPLSPIKLRVGRCDNARTNPDVIPKHDANFLGISHYWAGLGLDMADAAALSGHHVLHLDPYRWSNKFYTDQWAGNISVQAHRNNRPSSHEQIQWSAGTWPYTISDALNAPQNLVKLEHGKPKKPINDPALRTWIEKITRYTLSSDDWHKEYAQAYSKLTEVGATWAPSARKTPVKVLIN